MGNDSLADLLQRAAQLYRKGELLSALAEWEHALAIAPSCEPARRALAHLRDNYDLLDETLRPGGQPLDLSELHPPANKTYKTRGGVVLAPVETADTQPSEFSSEATAELPGIKALEAVASAQLTAGALAADDDFHNQPTGDMPGIDSLAAMVPQGARPSDARGEGFHSMPTAELPGIKALEAVASAQLTDSALSADDDFHNQPTGDMPGIDSLAAMAPQGARPSDARGEGFHSMPTAELPGLGAVSALVGLSAGATIEQPPYGAENWAGPAGLAPSGAPQATGLDASSGTGATVELQSKNLGDFGDFDELELGRAGAPPAPATGEKTAASSTLELGTRPTEELAMFARSRDFSLELNQRSRLQPLSPDPAGRRALADDPTAEELPGVGRRRADGAAGAADMAFSGPEFADESGPIAAHQRTPNARDDEQLKLEAIALGDTLGGDEEWQKSALTPAGLESREVSFPSLDDIERTIREDVERDAPSGEAANDRTRRRIKALIERAQRAHAQGDTVRAIIALELAFVEDPDSAVWHKLLNLHRDSVAAIFELFLGEPRATLALNVALGALKYEHIDARAAFLLSRVDGSLTVEDLLDVAGMPRVEALRYLSSMVLRGILILSK